jgi:hypothetical protein
MKNLVMFLLYVLLGLFIVISYKKIIQVLSSQEFKTPLAASSFSLENAPNESMRATIVSLSGEAAWQSRIATQPAQITKPIQIQQGEKIVTKEDGLVKIIFTKKANITINSNTEIDLIQTLSWNILVEQNTGFAEYMVLSGALNVRSHGILIQITAGNSSVSVSENNQYITVDVEKGSITAGYNDVNYVTQVVYAHAGEKLIYRADTKNVSLIPSQ